MKPAFYSILALALSYTSASAQLLRQPATVQALRAASLPKHGMALAARAASTTVLRPGQITAYGYSPATKQWEDPISLGYTYNAQALVTQEVAADSASSTPYYRTFTAYNAAQNPLSVSTQYYDSGSWTDDSRDVSAYDAQQQITLQEHQEADQAGNWITAAGTRYLNTYDAANHLTAQTVQVYRPTTQAYADSVRYQYTVAATGEWTSRLTQVPDGQGKWQDDERWEKVVWYNFAEMLVASVDLQVPTATGQWETVARQQGTYTPTRWELLTQHQLSGSWENEQRQLATFDSAGNPTLAEFDSWNGSGWDVILALENQYTYNTDNSIRFKIVSFDFGGTGLQPVERQNFGNYQSIALATRANTRLAAPLLAYPNPSNDGRFTVELPTTLAAAHVSVIDGLGREVAHQAWQGSARSQLRLDLSSQQPGLYTVHVQTPAGRLVQKISIR
ncbi:hypothetical protein GCM10022409_08560 [Hymenobacter glaciei]|uniref:Secretion system C-terminal sorting domain-containing protein n=1 Tax=Hymenobacter glaciei TaxID=877209 RepID=A0ABP7TIP4_9BACT